MNLLSAWLLFSMPPVWTWEAEPISAGAFLPSSSLCWQIEVSLRPFRSQALFIPVLQLLNTAFQLSGALFKKNKELWCATLGTLHVKTVEHLPL